MRAWLFHLRLIKCNLDPFSCIDIPAKEWNINAPLRHAFAVLRMIELSAPGVLGVVIDNNCASVAAKKVVLKYYIRKFRNQEDNCRHWLWHLLIVADPSTTAQGRGEPADLTFWASWKYGMHPDLRRLSFQTWICKKLIWKWNPLTWRSACDVYGCSRRYWLRKVGFTYSNAVWVSKHRKCPKIPHNSYF